MKKYISRFHYLTQDLPQRTHIEQVQIACEAGANWVQYRCLTKSDEELLADLHAIAAICDDWGATLIVTDHVHLLDKADIQGVHIEDMQADFKAVRATIGPDKTLGASANTFEDIQRIAESQAVDYIGCGPLATTQTKPNNYPLLGIEGYRNIALRMAEEKIEIPLLAVGGVTADVMDELIAAGVYGVAVSAAVNGADHPTRALKELYHKTVELR
ncbi:thiamine phosphate synthase [Pedobacter sp. SYSU D00535]|uniref:thiamine phosphate synthase n=1 Tax=Pedobacter sp. SYSU D00535 TaxID=2810308 RepID=UPI001A96B861